MSNHTGKTLGPYRLLQQVGAGGMATVYKAYQPGMDRYVAVKILPPAMANDEQFAQRFQREARALAKLEYAHILPVYDYGQSDDLTYLVMRYIESGTLRDSMDRGRLQQDEIERIITQVAGALDHAHRLGIIHRDIKPANILIDAQGDVYLTDFGVAHILEGPQKLTQSGVGIGTPAYMSPEQGQGLKIDHRTDIYALGIVLYEMLTGRVPFQAETPLAVILKHMQEALPLPRTVNPQISEMVERVVLKALAKEPEGRFQSASELARSLSLALREGGIADPVASASVQKNARQDVSLFTRVQRAWTRPLGKAALLGGVAFLLVLSVWLLGQTSIIIEYADGQLRLVPLQETANDPLVTVSPTTGTTDISPSGLPPSSTPQPTSTPNPLDLATVLNMCQQDKDICVAGPGQNPQPLGIGNFIDGLAPNWSPDGTGLLFEACPLESPFCQRNAYRVNRDGTDLNIFITNARYPTWSPDGQWIAYLRGAINLIRPDGSGAHAIVNMGSDEVHWLAWSPDSRQIAWIGGSRQEKDGWSTVFVTRTDGTGGLHAIYENNEPGRKPAWQEIAWSPDAQSVVFRLEDGTIYQADAACNVHKDSCESLSQELALFPTHWTARYLPQWAGEQVIPSRVLYEEDFEDGKADGLISAGVYWKVVSDDDGNKVYEVDTTPDLHGSTIEFGSQSWIDYAIVYRVKFLNQDAAIWVNFRNSTQGSYVQLLSLQFDAVALFSNVPHPNWQPLLELDYNVTQGVWYLVRVEAQGETLRVYVNDALQIEKTDSQVSAGNISIGNLGNTHALFDDIRVTALEAAP